MRYFSAILFALFAFSAAAQRLPSGVASIRWEEYEGEEILSITTKSVYKFASRARQRQYDRLVRNVKKVYPLALEAERIFDEMESDMSTMKVSQRRTYVAKKEREIEKKYTPVLRNMTFSQGKILLKLIDRQTSHTSYDILLELRGRFRASIWQGVAKLFDADLNATYDASGEDRDIEEIIELIERGEL